MATKVFMRNLVADVHRGDRTAKLDGVATPWSVRAANTTQGAAVTASAIATVTGPTAGVDAVDSTLNPVEFITAPIDQNVTISGAITVNVWMEENNMSANVGAQCVIERLDSTGAIVSTILNNERGVEVVVGAGVRTVNNWAPTPTSTNMVKGDRFRIRVAGNDVGTMASGFTFDFGFNGGAAADGDSFVSFTETFGFLTTTPAGSQLFLTDTASTVSAGTVEREAWTSRGAGVQTDVTNTSAGPTAGIQVTDTAGGSAAEWYTKQVQAFTLAGPITVNMRGLESNAAANASLRTEIATCAADGTGAAVWASAALMDTGGSGELGTTEVVLTGVLAGADVAVTNGQRLRVRVYLDDNAATTLVTGHTVTTHYAGTSGGASGDAFVTLSQTIAEFVGGGATAAFPFLRRSHQSRYPQLRR